MRLARTSLCSMALLILGMTRAAQAQMNTRPPPQLPTPSPSRHESAVPIGTSLGSLSSHLGVAVAKRLLSSSNASERRRGIERLGTVGSPRALELLVQTVASGRISRDSRALLVAVRALAPHVQVPEARQALVRLMGHLSGNATDGADPLLKQVRQSAAAALAASQDGAALQALGEALRQNGPAADAARAGVTAHPPRDLSPLLKARGMPTVTLVRTLRELGDQRAFSALRTMVRRASPEVRAEAALTLTELGDLETVELARYWLAHKTPTVERVAAARILALTHAPGAAAAIGALLSSDATRRVGIDLALTAPQPELVDKLTALLQHADESDVPGLLAAIGRAGGARAVRVLAQELSRPKHAALAAYVLALTPGDAARETIERALNAPSTERTAARAAVVRHVALADDASGMRAALERLLASHNPADRAAGAWGQAALDPARAAQLLTSRDPVLVRAAARAALNPRSERIAAERLATEKDPLTRDALAIALADPGARDRVPTSRLLELIDEGGAATPIAALALAARDDTTLRPRIAALLASGDPLVRAQAALGLGASTEPSAIGLLDEAYRFEPDPRVRRAIVVALGEKTWHSPTLKTAATLDGAPAVRQAAKIALAKWTLGPPKTGSGTFWMRLVSNATGRGAGTLRQAAILETPSGLDLPLVADPDGLIAVVGLPRGPVRLRLAPTGDPGQAPGR